MQYAACKHLESCVRFLRAHAACFPCKLSCNHTLALLVPYAFAVCQAADWMCFALQMTIAAMVTSMNPSITARQNTGQDSEQVCVSPKAPTSVTCVQGTSLKSKKASMVTSQLIISRRSLWRLLSSTLEFVSSGPGAHVIKAENDIAGRLQGSLSPALLNFMFWNINQV